MPAPQLRANVRYSSNLGLIPCLLFQSKTSLPGDSPAGRSLGHDFPLMTKSFSFCLNPGSISSRRKPPITMCWSKSRLLIFPKPYLFVFSSYPRRFVPRPGGELYELQYESLIVPPRCLKSEVSSVAATEKRIRFNTLRLGRVIVPKTCPSLMLNSGKVL